MNLTLTNLLNQEIIRISGTTKISSSRMDPIAGERLVIIDSLGGIRSPHCKVTRCNSDYWLNALSEGGTEKNGTVLSLDSEHLLLEGDQINLAGELYFEVGYRPATDNNYALLIGHDGGNLDGTDNDLQEMSKILGKRGFLKNQIKILRNDDVSSEKIQSALWTLVPELDDQSRILIYYSGHGYEKGLRWGRQSKEIRPTDLYSVLNYMPGKKALILDNCGAGVFVDEAELTPPKDTYIIAAAKANQDAREGSATILGGRKMGRLTRYIVEYFQTHTHRFDLTDLRDYLTTKLENDAQNPQFYGTAGFSIVTSLEEGKQPWLPNSPCVIREPGLNP